MSPGAKVSTAANCHVTPPSIETSTVRAPAAAASDGDAAAETLTYTAAAGAETSATVKESTVWPCS